MAMIKCSECGQMVSSKAQACPGCGLPISAKDSAAKKSLAALVAVGFGAVAAVVVMTVFIMNGIDKLAVPGVLAFAVGALAGWTRVIR
jgi:hypothetical protein